LKADTYDVVAVDYLAIIDTPGVEERYKREEIRRLVAQAAKLTRSYVEGKGIVFITPAQINREGKKASEKKKEGEKKYDLTAISTYSEMYHDADFVWSLFSDDDMKEQNKWLLEVHKVRHYPPQWYPIAVLIKDQTTGHVRETVGISAGYLDRSPLHGWDDRDRDETANPDRLIGGDW
jgi:hypothetical protein